MVLSHWTGLPLSLGQRMDRKLTRPALSKIDNEHRGSVKKLGFNSR